MMYLPFRHGFIWTRLRKYLDIIIKKYPGSTKLTCEIIIFILEGDMNRILGVIRNRRLVLAAVKTPHLSEVQFGNRESRTSIDSLLLKVATMGSLRIFRLNDRLINNYAAAC